MNVCCIDLRLHDLYFTCICLRLIKFALLQHARADRCHTWTEARADDGRHQVTAECRTGHFHIDIIHLKLGIRYIDIRVLIQEVHIGVHIDIKVSAVCRQSCMQSCCASRSQVAADVACPDQKHLRLLLHYHITDNIGISFIRIDCQRRIFADDDFVRAISAKFFC